jgi:hypothetical protein
MLFAYESPGMNALGWLAEKTLKPEALDFFSKSDQMITHVTSIQWSQMFMQLIQVGTLGICSIAIVRVLKMKEVGMMCLWLMIVEMVATVIRAVNI